MVRDHYLKMMPKIKTLMFDVDGVLTDGTVILMPDGELVRNMHTKDGLAMKKAIDAGLRICIITKGTSEAVATRLKGLGVKDVFIKVDDKMDVFEDYCIMHDLKKEEILYMGDDLPDYEVMSQIGIPCCPADAVQEIKDISTYVSTEDGGKGAVRDVIEKVMRVQDLWEI